jgi:hypothetical protein
VLVAFGITGGLAKVMTEAADDLVAGHGVWRGPWMPS